MKTLEDSVEEGEEQKPKLPKPYLSKEKFSKLLKKGRYGDHYVLVHNIIFKRYKNSGDFYPLVKLYENSNGLLRRNEDGSLKRELVEERLVYYRFGSKEEKDKMESHQFLPHALSSLFIDFLNNNMTLEELEKSFHF